MGRKIASIHSHPNCYSFPSPDNFDILENDFEDYEIITSYGAMWIVEFNGSVDNKIRENFQFKIGDDINDVINTIRLYYIRDIDEITEKVIGNYLVSEIDKKIDNIRLNISKVELD